MQDPHGDPSQLRISDSDRHKVAEVLREAAAEGRLDLEELDERLEAAYAAKVYADLVPLTFDLPTGDALPVQARPAAPQPAPGLAPRYNSSVAVMSAVDRKGMWEIGESHSSLAFMGAVSIDLRQVRFAQRETVVYANAIMGSVDLVVNAFTHVIVEGVGIMGAYEQARDKVPPQLTPDSPVVRVKGLSLMGAVTVVRKQMPGEPGPLRRKMLGE